MIPRTLPPLLLGGPVVPDLLCLGLIPSETWSFALFHWRETLDARDHRDWLVVSFASKHSSRATHFNSRCFWLFDASISHPCPNCREPAFVSTSTRTRVLRRERTETHVHLSPPMVHCPDCGLYRVRIAWAEDRKAWRYIRSLSRRSGSDGFT